MNPDNTQPEKSLLNKKTLDELEECIGGILKNNVSETFSPEATNPVTFVKILIDLAKKNGCINESMWLSEWATPWFNDVVMYTSPDRYGYVCRWRDLLGVIGSNFPPNEIPSILAVRIQQMITQINV